MLEKIKLAIRQKSGSLDEEIKDCINECYKDMDRVGIAVFDLEGNLKPEIEKEPLVIACQKHYARWQFNFEGEGEKYQAAYISTRDGMSLSTKYTKQNESISGEKSGGASA